VLVELSVMEQWYQAVLAVVQDGWRVVEVARRLGVSRQSIHVWIARYEQGGLASLADRSHRPSSCPHQIPPETEARICELRRQHPGWGPRRIEHQLRRAGVDPVPSRSSVYRCLRRHGLIELRRRRRRREEFRRFERDRPMQLWQMDVMGGVRVEDGTEAKILTGIDDHSRFCVAAGLVRRGTSKAICGVFAASLRRFGIPDEILTDNGKVFTARFGPYPTEVLFDRICRENGISHRHTGVRSPTTTGKMSGSTRAYARSSWPTGGSSPWRRPRPPWTGGWRPTTPSAPTRPWTWLRRRNGSVSSHWPRMPPRPRSMRPRTIPVSGSCAGSLQTAWSRWTTRCSRSATPTRVSSSTSSWTTR
jgi:transposase